jgi:GMP synthase (glutamine-hydrolysing)
MHVHFVVHEAFEAPGAFEIWANARGYTVGYSRVYVQEALPESVKDMDLLIILGGPQNAETTKEECPHFDAAAECLLISKCIAEKKAVVGVCLGAQLLGKALGALYDHSPETEIGMFPINLTSEGKTNEKFSHFGDRLNVGHWHSDMPGLTADSQIIAYSEGCPRQIVQYSDLVYGFQCHMEFTKDVIELLIAHTERDLAAMSDLRFVQVPEVLRANQYDGMNLKLFVFLDKLMSAYESTCALDLS